MQGRSFEPAPLPSLARQSFHPWLVVGVICIGAFIGQLDASIVQLALPALQQTFKVSVSEVRWAAIAYLLAFATFLPMFRRLEQKVGHDSLDMLFDGRVLLDALESGLVVLIFFALAAAALSLVRRAAR